MLHTIRIQGQPVNSRQPQISLCGVGDLVKERLTATSSALDLRSTFGAVVTASIRPAHIPILRHLRLSIYRQGVTNIGFHLA